MLTSVPKSHKTSGNLDKLYIDNWQEIRGRIGMGTLYLVFYDLQGLDKGPTEFRKQSQYNELSFCS